MSQEKNPPLNEAKYSVDVEGLPRFYMDADSPAQVKMALRKLLKKASSIDSVERVNDAKIKKDLRQRIKGADTDKRYVDEKLDPRKDDAGDYVKDFRKSDAPQFKGKSDKKKREMAIAAYLADKDKLKEDLRKWFGKGKKGDWVRVGTDGEIKGDCARDPGEGKPKCMPRSKAHSMSKDDRASAARRKRRADPEADRPGTGNKPIMVKTDKEKKKKVKEEFELAENYRTLARHGMGTETKMSARVGTEIDYYDGSGSKRMGKITKMGPKSYIVKDDKDGKNRQFFYHDRTKAKELLAKHGKGKYNEEVELDEAKFTDKQIKMAYGILNDPRVKGGNYSGAVRKIEGIAKGLSKHPGVAKALRVTNEDVELDEGTVQISFRSAGDKRKWMKKQSIAVKEIVKQTPTFVELPAGFKKYAKKEDHPEIYQVKESVEQLDELSPKTVSSYTNKRTMGNRGIGTDDRDRSKSYYQAKARAAKKAGKLGDAAKYAAKAKRIDQGLSRAVARHHAQRTGTDHLKRKSVVKRVPQAYKDRAKHGPTQNPHKAVGESVEQIDEKNVPTKPALWAKFKAQAKAKFDVYPSAYANGWAAKQYKAAGGGWKTVSEETLEEMFEVKYAKNKRGPIKVTKFKNLDDAKEFLATVRAGGMNGIISKGGKPVKEDTIPMIKFKQFVSEGYGKKKMAEDEDGKTTCTKCDGDGCDHCDDKGYHMDESSCGGSRTKKEELSPAQKKHMDQDKDGDIDGADMAALRAKKKDK